MIGIKQRVAILNEITGSYHTGSYRRLPMFCVAEVIQLQIRKICETLALGCLVVHRDLEGAQSRRLSDAYQADFIIKALGKLHQNFYPRPSMQVLQYDKPVSWIPIKHGFLTKAELLKSYRHAGDFLHVGDINDILSNKQMNVDLASIRLWVTKLMTLLNHHHIYLADPRGTEPAAFDDDGNPIPRRQIVILMHEKTDGNPRAHLMELVSAHHQSKL